jgi:23S rRNA (cytosine1962-C5)-methyltransferase
VVHHRPVTSPTRPIDEIALLDAGAGRRLERFGERVVDRPHPAAILSPAAPRLWRDADLRFDRDAGWTGRSDAQVPWTVAAAGLSLELRATDSGGVGLFPEQLANGDWVVDQVEARIRAQGTPAAVLNLFAHTGLLTLVAARAGATVTHVDAARTAVAWARRNAQLSGLAEAPVRWIVDDAVGFVRREARRRRRYDGILLDPPAYGHAGRRTWRLDADLGDLLFACSQLVAPGAFLLLTAHTAGFDDDRLIDEVRRAWPVTPGGLEVRALELEATSGATLPLGTAIRVTA